MCSKDPGLTRVNQEESALPCSNDLIFQGIWKAYDGQTQFTAALDEDMDTSIGIVETLSDIFDVWEVEMRQAIALMPKDDALSFYSNHARYCGTFADVIAALRAF